MESGDLLGERYRLVTQRGQGGTAVVWQARDEVLGREVAVKLLAPRLAGDSALVSRLRSEAQAAARLHHPHVVTVYDFGEAPQPDGPPVPYVVLELVAGRSLSDALRSGPLPWPEAVEIAAQVAAALAAAHTHGIVHRDVKPDNVMLTGSGAKLVDFGISATIGETDPGPDGELLCTPAYLAPERLETGPVRAACDVYGLGLVLYKSLTGELPWRYDGMTELLTAHRRVDPAPLPPLPGLPDEVVDLCHRCLAKRPADRPTSAEAARVLGAAAAASAGAVTVAAALSVPAEPEPDPTPTVVERVIPRQRLAGRGRRALALTAAGVMLMAVALGARTVLPTGDSPDSRAEAVACQVRYDIREDSGSDFVAGVTLTNVGADPVEPWRLDFAFPGDQRVVASSAGVWQQAGQSVVVEGDAQSAMLPAGRSMIFGFEGRYLDANPLPTEFHLNGIGCVHVLSPADEGAGQDRVEAGSGDAPQPPVDEPDNYAENNGDQGGRDAAEPPNNGNPGKNGNGNGNNHGNGDGPGNGNGNGNGWRWR